MASAFALAGVLLCGQAVVPALARADENLEVVGGTEARTVPLEQCPERTPEASEPGCIDGSGPYSGGQLTVLIHNASKTEALIIRASYQDSAGGKVIPLDGTAADVFLLESTRPASLRIAADKTLPLTLGFKVEDGDAPSVDDGTLLIEAAGEQPVPVPIQGERRSFAGVSLVPSTLTMNTDHRKATVLLEGPELAEYLSLFGHDAVSLTLYGPTGHTEEATLVLPGVRKVQSRTGRLRAKGTVRVEDSNPTAGKYTGKLTLPEVPADNGSLSIELSAHDAFWVLVILVLAGALVIGFGGRLVTTGTRRKLLEAVLEQTYGAFACMAQDGETQSWRLDDMLGEPPKQLTSADKKEQREKQTVEGRLQGLAALRYSIANARSSQDLDEDAARVLDVVARMQRWLRVEPLARRLAEVAGANGGDVSLTAGAPSGAHPHSWECVNTVRDTRALRAMASREPENAAKADDLVARLMFQIDWHNRLAALWRASAGDSGPRGEVLKLDKALGDTSKVEERSAAEQDGLLAGLDALAKKTGAGEPDELPPITGEPPPAGAEKLGVTKVEWSASPHLFTGWATLDEPSYDQLTQRVATSSRGLYTPNLSDIAREVKLLKLPDVYWSLAIVAFASAAYGVTAYDDTWGSLTDLATAFLAGALGKAAINWAALPIFQSIRLRKADS